MVESYFTPKHVESMRPYIQKTADELLDKMKTKGPNGSVDLVESFALPFPTYVRHSCLPTSKTAPLTPRRSSTRC